MNFTDTSSRLGRRGAPLLLAGASLLLSACAGVAFGDGSAADANTGRRVDEVMARKAPAAAPAPQRYANANAIALREGIKLYDDGDFNGAIRRLGNVDVAGEAVANRLIALKYTAFSYCVTSRPGPCRQAFEKALRLDPSFDLAPGERSHPLWGPVFVKAKKGG